MTHPERPLRFAGLPLSSWLFGLRTWLAMVLALYVAFWLQLGGASSAATCVGILALPTRGQVFDKAIYRLVGTIVGIAASYVIATLFADAREPFLVAVAGWIGLCVFAARQLDGNQAYGAVLSGYTVAIVALASIDAPDETFANGTNRGAAILIGVLATWLVNDLFAAPGVRSGLVAKLQAIHRKVRALVLSSVTAGGTDPVAATQLLGEITGLHPDIQAMRTESLSGKARAAAARRACSALVREVRAAGALAATFRVTGEDPATWQAGLAKALGGEGGDHVALMAHCDRAIDAPGSTAAQLVAARGARGLVDHDRTVRAALQDIETGEGPTRAPRLPLYRSRRGAARDAMRVFLAVLIASALLALSGWPGTVFALIQVASLAGISATNPDPFGFAVGAVIAMPITAAIAGIVQFLVLDGTDQFPLLALAMLPPVMAGCLLIRTGKPLLFTIGFLDVVFFPVLLAPANPQDYNPQTFVINSALAITAVVALFVLLATLLPTDDKRRCRWLISSIRRDLRAAAKGAGSSRLPDAEASYRAADRLGQVAALKLPDDAERRGILAHAQHLAEVTFAARWCHYTLGELNRSETVAARAALAALDGGRLREEATALSAAARGGKAAATRWAAANLARTAALIERYPDDIAAMRRVIP